MTTLNAEIRENKGKGERAELRDSGKIPAVFYGFQKESTPLSVDKKAFSKAFKEAGETSTITLTTPNGEFNAMVHDVQYDSMTGEAIHIDFLSVDMTKEVEVDVPLEFIGQSEAVKGGGVLVKVMHEVEVSALPSNIPQHLDVDLSKLVTMDDIITLADVNLPEGVKFTEENLDMVVASVTAQQEESEEDSAGPDLDSIEVEKKGKAEEEEEK